MKAKVTRGGGFRGALNYAFDMGRADSGAKRAEHVGGNMSGVDPRELSAEFAALRQLRPDIDKPVWHCSLSLPDGERLDAERWASVAEDLLRAMEFDPGKTLYVAVRHNDTDHDHIHIIASRVGLDGRVWHGKWEAKRAIEATQQLEKAHGLTVTPGLGDTKAERKTPPAREIGMAERRGEISPRERLQQLIDNVVKEKPSAAEFAERLEAAGITVRANVASTGRMNGFSFQVGGLAYKGADLGAAYKWSGLQGRGVTYSPDRDGEALARFKGDPAGPRTESARLPRDARVLKQEYTQQWKPAQQERRTSAWKQQREKESQRRASGKGRFEQKRDQIRANKGLSTAGRKAHLSLARMEKVQGDLHARAETLRERAELKAELGSINYLDFLAEKAAAGNGLALAEMRGRAVGPGDRERERVIEPDDPQITPPHEAPILQSLAYSVSRRGDVTYRDSRGQDLIKDAGQRVNVLRESPEAIEIGLRLAVQKYGLQVKLTGTEEFKRAAAEVAARIGMEVRFRDEALDQYKTDQAKRLEVGRGLVQEGKERHSLGERSNERSDLQQRQRDDPEQEQGR